MILPRNNSMLQILEPRLRTVKRLFALSFNRCAFPDCEVPIIEDSGTVTGQICHIKAHRPNGPRYDVMQTDEDRHSFQNLILLCGRHSKIIDSEPWNYTVDGLAAMKASHEQHGVAELTEDDARRVDLLIGGYRSLHIRAGGHVMVGSPGGVQTSNVVIKTANKAVTLQAPTGSIASDLLRRNYSKHLIDRYNDFAKEQPKRTFQFFRIYKRIEKHFGAKWDLIPIERFEDLIAFLQAQIDASMIGSLNRSKGRSNYSTFAEYRQKYTAVRF
jgi:hypothetical protein